MNLLFIDTEFSDFVEKKLVSIALVSPTEKFYAENSTIKAQECSVFVQEHIFPLLEGGVYAKSYENLAGSLYEWLETMPADTVIIGDYQGDWTIMARLLTEGDTRGLPGNIKGFENVFMLLAQELAHHYNVQTLARHEKQAKEVDQVFNKFIEKWLMDNRKIAHHALDDAQANCYAYYQTLNFIKTM